MRAPGPRQAPVPAQPRGRAGLRQGAPRLAADFKARFSSRSTPTRPSFSIENQVDASQSPPWSPETVGGATPRPHGAAPPDHRERGGLLPRPPPDGFPVLLGAFGGLPPWRPPPDLPPRPDLPPPLRFPARLLISCSSVLVGYPACADLRRPRWPRCSTDAHEHRMNGRPLVTVGPGRTPGRCLPTSGTRIHAEQDE